MKNGAKGDSQERLVIRTFDEKADSYARGYKGDTGTAHSFNIRMQRVYELFEERKGGKVLDIGCGPGITVEHLVERGFEVYGVDISPEMINECQKEFGHLSAAHFSVGKIEAMEFPGGWFDVVLCVGVVEYVDDDLAAIKEMARVTKPGGTIIVTLPNLASPYRIWQKTVYKGLRGAVRALRRRPPAPEVAHREYSRAAYVRLLESCGLKVTDIVYYNFSLLVFPVDRLFPRLAVRLSRSLERFARSGPSWLGTGFIVRADKT